MKPLTKTVAIRSGGLAARVATSNAESVKKSRAKSSTYRDYMRRYMQAYRKRKMGLTS